MTYIYGTNYSSPIFASAVSLLNDGLIAAGKPVLGFWNTFLYSTGADVMNDITTGTIPDVTRMTFLQQRDGIL